MRIEIRDVKKGGGRNEQILFLYGKTQEEQSPS